MAELVLAVLVGSVMSLPVTVRLPAVLRVILKLRTPAIRAALVGKLALLSVELKPTVSMTLVSGFQLASTALTVRLKAGPAVWVLGVPVLPLAVPGAALSLGRSSCSLANAPALTVIGGLVLAVFVPSMASVAVTVRLPTVLRVRLK